MPHIVVIEPCYEQLTEMKNTLIAKKKANGESSKVTYSEIICSLIRTWKNSNYSAEMLGSGSGEYLIKNITAPGSASSSQKSQSLEV